MQEVLKITLKNKYDIAALKQILTLTIRHYKKEDASVIISISKLYDLINEDTSEVKITKSHAIEIVDSCINLPIFSCDDYYTQVVFIPLFGKILIFAAEYSDNIYNITTIIKGKSAEHHMIGEKVKKALEEGVNKDYMGLTSIQIDKRLKSS